MNFYDIIERMTELGLDEQVLAEAVEVTDLSEYLSRVSNKGIKLLVSFDLVDEKKSVDAIQIVVTEKTSDGFKWELTPYGKNTLLSMGLDPAALKIESGKYSFSNPDKRFSFAMLMVPYVTSNSWQNFPTSANDDYAPTPKNVVIPNPSLPNTGLERAASYAYKKLVPTLEEFKKNSRLISERGYDFLVENIMPEKAEFSKKDLKEAIVGIFGVTDPKISINSNGPAPGLESGASFNTVQQRGSGRFIDYGNDYSVFSNEWSNDKSRGLTGRIKPRTQDVQQNSQVIENSTERVFADFEPSDGRFHVFGLESGKSYYNFSTLEEAEAKARELNATRSSGSFVKTNEVMTMNNVGKNPNSLPDMASHFKVDKNSDEGHTGHTADRFVKADNVNPKAKVPPEEDDEGDDEEDNKKDDEKDNKKVDKEEPPKDDDEIKIIRSKENKPKKGEILDDAVTAIFKVVTPDTDFDPKVFLADNFPSNVDFSGLLLAVYPETFMKGSEEGYLRIRPEAQNPEAPSGSGKEPSDVGTPKEAPEVDKKDK